MGLNESALHGIPEIRWATRVVCLAPRVLLVCTGYYAGSVIVISFAFPPSGISTIWPPNAIVLAALLLETPGVWWVYLLAVLPTHLHVVTSFQEGVPLAVMLSQFTTNAVHIIVGAAAVRAVSGAPPRFDSLRGMAAFILLAAIGAGAIACAVAVALFQLTGWITDPWLAWRQRRTASPSSRSRRISRSIVEAHGGRIWAAANPDRGLTLHVELPTRVYPGTDVQDHLRAKAVG